MNVGFSETEFVRVRRWLLSALEIAPEVFDEAELLANLRSNTWHLITTEHAAAVLELVRFKGELIANVLLLGGEKGKALREILSAKKELSEILKTQGFTQIVGTPRDEFHRILKANGFEEQEQKELLLRL